jgi:hypothetical protein
MFQSFVFFIFLSFQKLCFTLYSENIWCHTFENPGILAGRVDFVKVFIENNGKICGCSSAASNGSRDAEINN